MTTIHLFSTSQESIWSLTAQSGQFEPDVMVMELFVLLHGMLFTNIQLDDFAPTPSCFLKRLKILTFASTHLVDVVRPPGFSQTISGIQICNAARIFNAFLHALQLDAQSLAFCRVYLKSLSHPPPLIPYHSQQTQTLANLMQFIPWEDLAMFFTSIPKNIHVPAPF